MNVNLNAGGILGGLLAGGIALAILSSSANPEYQKGMAKFVILAVIAGAFAGNFLVGLIASGPTRQQTMRDKNQSEKLEKRLPLPPSKQGTRLGRVLPVISVLTFWVPFVGLGLGIGAILTNRNVDGFPRTLAWVAASFSLVVTLGFVILPILVKYG